MEINKLFDNILDLPGIEGVCLFGADGQMYLNRLPAFLSNELFADAQRRIVAMYETMDENFAPSDDYMLRFSERWLLLRRADKHFMLILGGEKANLASTRMVTNMTMKHLTPELLARLAGGASAVASASSLVPPSPAPAVAKAPTRVPFLAFSAAKTSVAEAPAEVAAASSAPAESPKTVRMYRGRAY